MPLTRIEISKKFGVRYYDTADRKVVICLCLGTSRKHKCCHREQREQQNFLSPLHFPLLLIVFLSVNFN